MYQSGIQQVPDNTPYLLPLQHRISPLGLAFGFPSIFLRAFPSFLFSSSILSLKGLDL